MEKKMQKVGKVWLAGAGPGDCDLLTVKTKRLIETAEVIVYDALVSDEIISLFPEEANCIYVGKRSSHHTKSQQEINEILIEQADSGKKILRLKGGDPFVFGRGGEELDALVARDIPFEVVPGITSALSVPAYAGIPITHRDYVSSFHVITGHGKSGKRLDLPFQELVKVKGTLVFLMGVHSLSAICNGLLEAGMDGKMPTAILENGTSSNQKNVYASLDTLVMRAEENQVKSPAVILIGRVCELGKTFTWAKKRPLGNLQVLVTRPRQHQPALEEKLKNLGATVIEMPTVHIDNIESIESEMQFIESIESLGEYKKEWIVFTSPLGVRQFFEMLILHKKDIRSLFSGLFQTKFAVIGKTTGETLSEYGIVPDFIPEVYQAETLGNSLAEIIREDVVEQSRVTVFRAKKSSPMLLPPLLDAGILCRDVPIYETSYQIHNRLKKQIHSLLDAGEIDAVTFTSASTVQGFAASMERSDYSNIPAICIGEITCAEAKKYGMPTMVSEEATMDSMIELLQELADRKRGNQKNG